MADEDDIELDPIPHPIKRNFSRRTIIVGLVGFAAAEALTGGITWQMFAQGLHKIVLALAPSTASSLPLGALLGVYHGHSAGVNSVKWSPDNKNIVSGADDKTMQIWNAASRNSLFIYQGHNDAIVAVAWSSDGTRIVSGSRNLNLAPLFPTPTPTPVPTDTPGVTPIDTPTPDTPTPGPTDTPTPIPAIPTDTPTPPILVTPKISSISPASGSTSGGTTVILIGSGFTGATSVLFGSITSEILLVDSDIQIIVVSPAASNGGTVNVTVTTPAGTSAISSADQFTYISAPTPTSVPIPAPFDCLASELHTYTFNGIVDKDNPPLQKMTLTNCNNSGTEAWSASVFMDSGANWLTISSKSGILSKGSSQTISIGALIANLLPGTYTGHITLIIGTSSVKINIRLIISLPPLIDTSIQVWNAKTGSNPLTYLGYKDGISTLTWSPDGRRIASSSGDTTVQVWNAANGSPIFTYKSHSKAVLAVVWSPDGKSIASTGYDMTVRIWDATNGTDLYIYRGHRNVIVAVAWSPDGKHIASSDYDNTVHVWNVNNGSLVSIYQGHSDLVTTIAWSPDSNRIASGSQDSTVQIWDVTTKKTFFTFSGHLNSVRAVAWSSDGTRIASGSLDTTVQVWKAV